MPPTYYRGCWHVVSRDLFASYCQNSSLAKGVYNPKAVILHAALLRQAFAHCAKFLTAASRRSGGRVSVPLWLVVLSDQLAVVALVSHYLTNKLIARRPISKRIKLYPEGHMRYYSRFLEVIPHLKVGSNVLLTRSPCVQVRSRLACVRHAANVNPELGSNSS